ncbi:MFS transporter [Streptomyces sp. NPDC002640]
MPSAVVSPQATTTTPAENRRWPPIIWAALIGTFAIRALGFAYPFLPYHADSLGFSAQTTGWVVASFGAGWLIGQVGGGWLSDRIGPRATLPTPWPQPRSSCRSWRNCAPQRGSSPPPSSPAWSTTPPGR